MEVQAGLIHSLYRATQKGIVNWENSTGSGVYSATYKKGSVRIFRKYDERTESDDYDVVFIIYNSKGKIVDEFTDVDVGSEPLPALGHNSWYGICKKLFEDARRKAMRSDQTIFELIEEIDKSSTDLDDDIPF